MRVSLSAGVKLFRAQLTAPATLGRLFESRHQAIHVVASVAVIAEQQLVVIIRCATDRAVLALNALPSVLLNRDLHVGGELETARMTGATTIGTRDQVLRLTGLFVLLRVAETKVAIGRRCGATLLHRLANIVSRWQEALLRILWWLLFGQQHWHL